MNFIKHCIVLIFVAQFLGCSVENENYSYDDPIVDIPFEGSLSNIGTASIIGKYFGDEPNYIYSNGGTAIELPGNGSWVEFEPSNRIELDEMVEILFMFKRDDWENPYRKGSVSQTIAVVSGQSDKTKSHLSFSFYPHSLSFTVSFRDQKGSRCKLESGRDVISLNWHKVRLLLNSIDNRTTLYIDDKQVAEERCSPAVLTYGINRIKFGTWYKKNQAYSGLLDTFVIRSLNL